MPILKPKPHGKLGDDLLAFLEALNRVRREDGAAGIVGDFHMVARIVYPDGLRFPVCLVDRVVLANDWTTIVSCN